MPIKNIIFDLGGVLLNIDYNKTIQAFKQLGILHFEKMYSQYTANPLFEHLETGKVSEKEFYEEIKKALPPTTTTAQIQNAWNSMILDFREQSLERLLQLKNKYNVFLLSNTNAIHVNAFQQLFSRQIGNPPFEDYFHKIYYSHQVGLRKPHKTIFEYVLADAQITPEKTLFIDDSVNNITTAKQLDFHTHCLLNTEKIEEILAAF